MLAELEAVAQREGQARPLDDGHLPLRLEDMLAQAVEADLTLDVRRKKDGRATAEVSAVAAIARTSSSCASSSLR